MNCQRVNNQREKMSSLQRMKGERKGGPVYSQAQVFLGLGEKKTEVKMVGVLTSGTLQGILQDLHV
jgi:hypothetical protein